MINAVYHFKNHTIWSNIVLSFKIYIVWPNSVYSIQNSHCMSEYCVFLKIYIICSSALRSRNSYCVTECNISFHINTTWLSVVYFHTKHYMTEYNVFFESALYIVSLEIGCILLWHNLLSKQRQRGATIDT